jgi:hypothetical protein
MKLIQDVLKPSNVSIIYEPLISFYECKFDPNTSTVQEQLIGSAKFNKRIQERLFDEYFTYSYPSEYLSQQVFEYIISSHGLDTNKTKEYFNAFDIGQKNNLNFNDFILGIYLFFFRITN